VNIVQIKIFLAEFPDFKISNFDIDKASLESRLPEFWSSFQDFYVQKQEYFVDNFFFQERTLEKHEL